MVPGSAGLGRPDGMLHLALGRGPGRGPVVRGRPPDVLVAVIEARDGPRHASQSAPGSSGRGSVGMGAWCSTQYPRACMSRTSGPAHGLAGFDSLTLCTLEPVSGGGVLSTSRLRYLCLRGHASADSRRAPAFATIRNRFRCRQRARRGRRLGLGGAAPSKNLATTVQHHKGGAVGCCRTHVHGGVRSLKTRLTLAEERPQFCGITRLSNGHGTLLACMRNARHPLRDTAPRTTST